MFRPREIAAARALRPTENEPRYCGSASCTARCTTKTHGRWAESRATRECFRLAPDLAIFCQMLLNGGIYAHRRILQRKTVAKFTAPKPLAANTHTLGWNVPTENSSSGHYFSKQSFGHTGFTGTSMWIDPQKQLLWCC